MAKRITPNTKEWEKEIRKIERFIKVTETIKGVAIPRTVIPPKPSRITKKKLQEIKQIRSNISLTVSELFGDNIVKEEPIKRKKVNKIDVDEQGFRNVSTDIADIKTGRARKPKEEKPKLTEEDKKARRSTSAKKAAETRRKQEEADPELKARRDAIRRENLKKAREARAGKRGATNQGKSSTTKERIPKDSLPPNEPIYEDSTGLRDTLLNWANTALKAVDYSIHRPRYNPELNEQALEDIYDEIVSLPDETLYNLSQNENAIEEIHRYLDRMSIAYEDEIPNLITHIMAYLYSPSHPYVIPLAINTALNEHITLDSIDYELIKDGD